MTTPRTDTVQELDRLIALYTATYRRLLAEGTLTEEQADEILAKRDRAYAELRKLEAVGGDNA